MPAQNQYDHTTHLLILDVNIDDKDSPQLTGSNSLRLTLSAKGWIYTWVEQMNHTRNSSLLGKVWQLPRNYRKMLTRQLLSAEINKLLTELHMH